MPAGLPVEFSEDRYLVYEGLRIGLAPEITNDSWKAYARYFDGGDDEPYDFAGNDRLRYLHEAYNTVLGGWVDGPLVLSSEQLPDVRVSIGAARADRMQQLEDLEVGRAVRNEHVEATTLGRPFIPVSDPLDTSLWYLKCDLEILDTTIASIDTALDALEWPPNR